MSLKIGAEVALIRLLGVSRDTLCAWLAGEAVPPANVFIAADLTPHLKRKPRLRLLRYTGPAVLIAALLTFVASGSRKPTKPD